LPVCCNATARLVRQQRASPHTIASYRDAFRLLLRFAQERLGKAPATLAPDDLDAALVGAFLDHVEQHRRNTPRTRNVRLAAIHAFCHYVAISEPAHLDRCRRILAIPVKRHERRPIAYLTRAETDALLAAPDVATWIGRRDRALVLLAVQTGLRVSELIHLRCGDLVLGTGAHLRCEGKGRKQRCTPLQRDMVSVLTAWLRERNGQPGDPLFATARGSAPHAAHRDRRTRTATTGYVMTAGVRLGIVDHRGPRSARAWCACGRSITILSTTNPCAARRSPAHPGASRGFHTRGPRSKGAPRHADPPYNPPNSPW